MKMYEYKTEYIKEELKSIYNTERANYDMKIIERLNTLGREGWELCAADGNCFYLKKEI